MKIKTSELVGAQLDWAVAKCEGIPATHIYIDGKGKYQRIYKRTLDEEGNITGSYMTGPDMLFHSMWEAGGPIIEREKIKLLHEASEVYKGNEWWATMDSDYSDPKLIVYGKTPLIAAMRCYIASKLGDKVEIPKELVK